MAPTNDIQHKALSIICAKHLHQCLWLPHTDEHPRLRVTYATTSNFGDESLPAVLFIGPMFGNRYLTLEIDKLARDCGVRVIWPDRPSMGGSTSVPLNIRMQVWLETVPALLQKVNVQHVSLVTHSAGGIYTLNTLAKLRSVLDPKSPYVALLAPWVPVASSNATLMTLASKIPTPVIDYLSPLQGFIQSKVAPTLSFSSGLFSSSAAMLGSQSSSDSQPTIGSEEDAAEKYGVNVETAKLIRSLTLKFYLAEDNTAANEEAKLCLMKGSKADWGALADYEACVQSFADAEGESIAAGAAKLKMDAAFASSDAIIGKGGQEYFEKCWRRESVAANVDFESRTFDGTNHDTVLIDFRNGGLKMIFEKIAGLGSASHGV